MTQPTIQFSCVQSAYEIRHACLRRDWNKLKTEMDWVKQNGATVEVKADDNSVFLRIARGNADGFDLITDLHPRDVSQIAESLRERGATIKEAAKP